MKPYNVVFVERVEHVVRVHEDSASHAAYKAAGEVLRSGKSWDFSRVEVENHDGSVDEVIV